MDDIVETRLLAGHHKRIKNRGIGGDNTEGIMARLDEITESKPNKIFLEIGTNDLALNLPISMICSNYTQIIDVIRETTPNTTIYVQSVLPRYDDPSKRYGVYNDSIVLLNKELKKITVEKALTFINLFDVFKDSQGKLNPKFSSDGVHLNSDGYLIWKKEIEKFVNN